MPWEIDMILLVSLMSKVLVLSHLLIYLCVGGSICGAFVVFGVLSVLFYKPWRRRVDRQRARLAPVTIPENEERRFFDINEEADIHNATSHNGSGEDQVETLASDAGGKR